MFLFWLWNIQKLESIRPLHPYVVSMTAHEHWISHMDFPEVRLEEMLHKPLPLEKLCKLTEVDDDLKLKTAGKL